MDLQQEILPGFNLHINRAGKATLKAISSKINRASIVLYLILLLFLIVCVLVWPDLSMSFKFKLQCRNPGDEANYFIGALMLKNGFRTIYDYDTFLGFCQGCTIYTDKNHFLTSIIYPPLMYVLIVPFTSMRIAEFIPVLFIINIILLALSALLIGQCLVRILGPKTGLVYRIILNASILLIVFLYSPTVDCLMQGQANILLLFLFCTILYSCLMDWKIVIGLCLALTISIKLFPILFLLYFAVRRDWKAIAWTLAWTLLINGAIVMTYGTGIYSSYVRNILPVYTSPHILTLFPFNRAIDGVILYYIAGAGVPASLHPAAIKVIALPLKLLLTVLFAIAVYRGAGRASGSDDGNREKAVSFCLFLSLVFLLLTSSWQYYHIWYLPCFLVAIVVLTSGEMSFSGFISALCIAFSWFWFAGLDGQISIWQRQTVWWMRNSYYSSFPLILAAVKLLIFFLLLFLYRTYTMQRNIKLLTCGSTPEDARNSSQPPISP
jgi:hypothetical protein